LIRDTADDRLDFGNTTILRNLAAPRLIEAALACREGVLAANGALAVGTGDRTGRSPRDKFLEDTPSIHDRIDWGETNRPISPGNFAALEELARDHLSRREVLYRFDGYSGADPRHRQRVTVVGEKAWHALFAKTLFTNASPADLAGFEPDWLVINACELRLHTFADYGLNSGVAILQSLEQRKVVILGTHYAGEMKKAIFYAMNFELPERDVLPMHCACNVDPDDHGNAALFFGLSGTGKATLSGDPARPLVGDDEHGWSERGIFNLEGGCYAKCIRLSREGEARTWDAVRFGSVLENVVLEPTQREPDYDDGARTENTRATYPMSHVPGAVTPSVAGHPRNLFFLTGDAFGVLPPVSRLSREQAMYYFIQGYSSQPVSTEPGLTEPEPSFSPCFSGPFLPRPPRVYAEALARRIQEHGSAVWLLNTGWTGGPAGVGRRFEIAHSRALVSAILDGSLQHAEYRTHPIFGLEMPVHVPTVPDLCLDPRNTWADPRAYDQQAEKLAKQFRKNEARFDISDEVRDAGPRV
jgi:phosphoenolpyruvate carboxykinase (ATP)